MLLAFSTQGNPPQETPHVLVLNDVKCKVRKMDDASVGVQENLSAEGTLPSKEKVWSVVTEMCRKNGITHNYNCAQKLCKSVEGNGLKHGCFVKLNGLAKSILKPSIPTLRSRGIKGILSCDSPRKKSRSSRTDKHEAING